MSGILPGLLAPVRCVVVAPRRIHRTSVARSLAPAIGKKVELGSVECYGCTMYTLLTRGWSKQ
jgi:hypothetical protein